MSIDEYQLLKSKRGNLEVIPLQAEDATSGRPVALKSLDGTLAVSDVTLPVAFVTSILAGESLSEAVDFGAWSHLGLAPVSPWDDEAVISLAVGMEEDGDFWPLVDTEGDEITITLTEGSAIGLPADVASALAPWRYVKFRSGTAASPVVQSGAKAAVTVTVAGEGEGAKKLTFTSGVGGVESNDLSVRIEVAEDDTLAADDDGNEIIVKLANATANSNTAALIEEVVQALAAVGDIDVSGMTVAANTAYTNAPVSGATVGEPAECVLDFGDDKTLTINSGVAGSIFNDLSFEVEVAANDTLAVSEDDGVITIKLANATATNNKALDIQTLVQGLSVSGVDMTHFTVTGSTEYDDDEPDGTSLGDIAECELDFGDDRVLTVTPGFSGSIYNDLSFTVETASGDTLAASETEGVITISLANTTNTKNTAALIQGELRGLSVSGVNMLGFTVAESAEYIADRPAGAKASKIFETETDKTLTITSGVFGAESNAIKFTFGVNDDQTDHDELDVSESAGVITILLADTTPAKNAAANIETAIQALLEVASVDVSGMTVVGNAAYNSTPSVALDAPITAVALEGGRVAVEDGVIEEVPLTGGDDFVIDAVSMTGGDEFVVDGQFTGGGNTFIRGILKR